MFRSWFIGYGLISRGQSPAKTLFRDILTKSAYQSSQMPFPIVVMNQQASGSLYNAQDPNVPIVEATPYEFGDWNVRGFIKTEMYPPPRTIPHATFPSAPAILAGLHIPLLNTC
jgi:hypothetical protein